MCLKTLAKTPFSPRDDSPRYFLPSVFLSSSNNYVTTLLAVEDYAAICTNPLLHDIKQCGEGLDRGGGGGCYWGDLVVREGVFSTLRHGRSR